MLLKGDSMQSHIRTLLCALLFAVGVLACSSSAPAQVQDEKEPGIWPPDSIPSVENQLKDLTEKLNLSKEQQASIKSVLEDQRQQMQAEVKGGTLSREDRKSDLRRIRETTSSKIRDLLNDEQQARFDQMEKERRERMRAKQEKSGEAPR